MWSIKCETAFQELKAKLVSAPVLAYPQFSQNSSQNASPIVLQTDVSNIGLGAVLEQGGNVIAYASRSLNKAERQYSATQKECLAAVHAMKQFRHYLLGRPFKLVTASAMAISRENGGTPLQMGTKHARVYHAVS